MSQLFARVYLDEDASALLAVLLRSRGFDAVTTQEMSNNGASDAGQLEYASQQGRVILTHNRADFEQLAKQFFAQQRKHAGIIVAIRRMPHDLLNRVLSLLNQSTADEIADNVWYL